jgi:hypothetical protein
VRAYSKIPRLNPLSNSRAEGISSTTPGGCLTRDHIIRFAQSGEKNADNVLVRNRLRGDTTLDQGRFWDRSMRLRAGNSWFDV